MDTLLYVVTHKEVRIVPEDRVLLGVGNANLNIELRDNAGENIAEKNQSYCELTALFWMWKNVKSDYIGLEHYRRFFCKRNYFKVKILSKKNIEKKLKKYDVIIPNRIDLKCSVFEHYKKMHIADDLDICRKIIEANYFCYLKDFDYVMQLKSISVCNMFIMSKSLMNEYCEWLFDVLFKAEKQIVITDRDIYQSRVFGFLSERLFNVWLHHKQLKVCYTPIYNIGDRPLFDKIKNKINNIFTDKTK